MGMHIDDDTVLVNLKLKVENIPNNDAVMTELHNTLIEYCNEYVPMKYGILAGSAKATPKYAQWGGPEAPYGHYMYTGIVYGPNIPIFENGVIVGWWSPPNKQPTGENLKYSTEMHPKATHHWEQAMLRDKKEPFMTDLSKIILDDLNKGGL